MPLSIIFYIDIIFTEFTKYFMFLNSSILNSRSPATHKMSPWVRTVFIEHLPRLLLMKRPKYPMQRRQKEAIVQRSMNDICTDNDDDIG